MEERYEHQGTNYEYGRSYDRHYGRDSASYHGGDTDDNLPASYRDRSRDRTSYSQRSERGKYFNAHSSNSSSSVNRTEGGSGSQSYEGTQDPNYREPFSRTTDAGESSTSFSDTRQKRGRSSRKSSHSPKSGASNARSRSYSHSASRSRSRSRSSDSRSSVSGSENWSSARGRSRSKDSDRESRNTENTQSSGGSKHAGLCIKNLASRSTGTVWCTSKIITYRVVKKRRKKKEKGNTHLAISKIVIGAYNKPDANYFIHHVDSFSIITGSNSPWWKLKI